MLIANIITTIKGFEAPDYINLVSSYEDRITTLPTLIVGWSMVKTIFDGESVSILNNVIDQENHVYWCFSKFEKRDDFERDINKFYNNIITILESKVKYNYFSLITNRVSRIKDLINFINNKKHKIIYVHNNRMIYIYKKNNIVGISLDECVFIGLDKQKVIDFIYRNSEYNHNCDISEILIENQDLVEKLKNNVKLLPLVYCG